MFEREPQRENAFHGVDWQTAGKLVTANLGQFRRIVVEGGFGRIERGWLAPSGKRFAASAEMVG